jgi:hypothetical protein
MRCGIQHTARESLMINVLYIIRDQGTNISISYMIAGSPCRISNGWFRYIGGDTTKGWRLRVPACIITYVSRRYQIFRFSRDDTPYSIHSIHIIFHASPSGHQTHYSVFIYFTYEYCDHRHIDMQSNVAMR